MADILTEKFTSSYPHIPISRPTRFLDTVRRLAAPTKSSAVGEKKLLGSPLVTYRRRVWVPRNRHKQGTCTCVCIYALRNCLVYSLCTFNADSSTFPMNVQQSGVSENMLQKAFLQCLEGGQVLCWTLAKPVTVGFYRDLHQYFRQWPPARSATQKTVGRFYLLIDVHFQSKKMASRPDNVYTFVQRVAESSRLTLSPLLPSYGGMATDKLKKISYFPLCLNLAPADSTSACVLSCSFTWYFFYWTTWFIREDTGEGKVTV